VSDTTAILTAYFFFLCLSRFLRFLNLWRFTFLNLRFLPQGIYYLSFIFKLEKFVFQKNPIL